MRLATIAACVTAALLGRSTMDAQERSVATIPTVGGVAQVRVLARGDLVALTVNKDGRLVFSTVLTPVEAMSLANALKIAVDSTTARPQGSPGIPEPAREKTYFAFEVDNAAAVAPSSMIPLYPSGLIGTGISGEVDAMFVVDTAGRYVPGTLSIKKSTNQLFASAVQVALPHMEFNAADKGGHKVRQLVMHPFTFTAPH